MNSIHVVAAVLLATSVTVHAQVSQGRNPAPTTGEARASPNAANALTDAVVQRIDSAAGEVVLKHGDIPNLAMPPMTMAFNVDKRMLSGLKVGDKIRFHAEIVDGRPKLTHVEPAS